MNGGRFVFVLLGILASFQASCALTSKGTALSPRYFSPELGAPPATFPAPAGESLALRLGTVEAASHLEERMAYRIHASELGYEEERRWTERPEEYLRRALEEELFERRHLRRIVSGAGPTLDVELFAFEELRGPTPRVRLALRFTLHDARQSSLERSLTVERPLAPPSRDTLHAQLVASALGAALMSAVAEVADEVSQKLVAPPDAPRAATESGDLARGTSAPARP
jgi:cholesterol transport system auxiliary component